MECHSIQTTAAGGCSRRHAGDDELNGCVGQWADSITSDHRFQRVWMTFCTPILLGRTWMLPNLHSECDRSEALGLLRGLGYWRETASGVCCVHRSSIVKL